MKKPTVNDDAVRVAGMLAACSDLLDDLESALDSAEQVCAKDILSEYAERIANANKAVVV